MLLPPYEGSLTVDGSSLDGWFYPVEGKTYKTFAIKYAKRIVGAGRIIEIGSYEGLSLYYLRDLSISGQIQIWSVDIEPRPKLVENTKKWGIQFICNESVEAAKTFPDEYFDLVFIDACHEYDQISNDLKSWLPKVRTGGLLLGHDYNWPGVKQAVVEQLPRFRTIDRLWYHHKLSLIRTTKAATEQS